MDILSIAIEASLEAGGAILEVYNSSDFNVELKDDHSPLTRADKASHEVIVKHLAKTDIPVLSEEDSKNHSYDQRKMWKQCWIVDPLDGTKEFIKRNGEFTVNIALVENGSPVMGVIYVPVKRQLYFAGKGEGAFLSVDGNKTSVKLPMQKFPSKFTIVGSRSHSSSETEAYVKEQENIYGEVDFLAAGSSLKFCLLAEGKAQSYPRFAPTMEWDTAAGQIIVEEAGGKMVQWPSLAKFTYNREELRNGWFLATAGSDNNRNSH